MSTQDKLPPLPEPALMGGIGDYRLHYTAGQMLDYASAAIAAQEAEPAPNPASDSPFDQALGAYASAVWQHDMAGMRGGYVALRDLFASQYAAPPAREAVALTEEQRERLIESYVGGADISDDEHASMVAFSRAVERAVWAANNLREPT